MDKLIPSIDSKGQSSDELLEQVIHLVKSIHWNYLKSNPSLSKRLNEEQCLLRQLLVEAEVSDQSFAFHPISSTSCFNLQGNRKMDGLLHGLHHELLNKV